MYVNSLKLPKEVINVYDKFVADRITELRLKKNVSEYQMSLDLGRNKTYI